MGLLSIFSREGIAKYFSYFIVHFSAFVLMNLVGGIAIYLIEDNASFIDALFTANSAVCVTGLITLDTGALKLGSQITVFLLIFFGGNILWSTVPVLLRRHFFQKTMHRQLSELGLDIHERIKFLNHEVEYRALGWILRIAYFHLIFWPLLAMVIIAASTQHHSSGDVLRANSINEWWFGFFISYSAINNGGFSLLSDNLISFSSSYSVLLPLSFLILIGNVGYPVIMYGSVQILYYFYGNTEPAFAFLIARPRKCFTHLFNRFSTLVLLGVIVSTTFLEFFLFLGLEYKQDDIAHLSAPHRALLGWFQSISTRTAGFNALDLAKIAPALQLIYAIFMYLTAYPFALTVRNSKEMDRVLTKAELVHGANAPLCTPLFREKTEFNVPSLSSERPEILPHHARRVHEAIASVHAVSGLGDGEDHHAEGGVSDHPRVQSDNDIKRSKSTNSLQSQMVLSYIDSEIGRSLPSKKKRNRPSALFIPGSATGSEYSSADDGSDAGDYTYPASPSRTSSHHHKPHHHSSHHSVHFEGTEGTAVPSSASIPSARGSPRSILHHSSGKRRRSTPSSPVTVPTIPEDQDGLRLRASLRHPSVIVSEADAAAATASMEKKSTKWYQKHHSGLSSLKAAAANKFTRDLTLLTIALLVITISESDNIRNTTAPQYMSIFGILFEISSAFGTVGLTLGFPNSPVSLAAQMNTFSKLVLMAVMLAGRHRGLPLSIDPAVYLPSLLSTHADTPAASAALNERVVQSRKEDELLRAQGVAITMDGTDVATNKPKSKAGKMAVSYESWV